MPRQELPRVVTSAVAADLGVGPDSVRHRVERGRWYRMAHGVLLTAPGPPTRDDWVLAGLAVAGPRAALSGWDAARTMGLGAPTPPHDVLVLARDGRHRQLGNVWVRPTARPYWPLLLPGEHPALPYVPVVHPARAVVDTAMQYRSLAPVRALVTSCVQRRVCTPEQLGLEFATAARNGSAFMRLALGDVLDGARSIAEAEAADWLRVAGVPAFELNVEIRTAGGELVAVVDVLWRELRAALEIDSREFHFSEQDWQATMARHNRLSRYALAVTHHPPSAVRQGRRAWAGEVAQWLRARADELGVPYVPGRGALRASAGDPPPLVVGKRPPG